MRKLSLLAGLLSAALVSSSCGKKVEPLAIATPGFQGVTPVVLNAQKAGSTVELSGYLGKDKKFVLVEFYADWCEPCQAFVPLLAMMSNKFSNLTIYRVNIDQWKSPVCRQFKINSVPALLVYAPDGQEIARDQAAKDWVQAQLDLLAAWENSRANR